MIQSRMIGAARVTCVMEYSGPTHAPDFLFPEVPADARAAAISASRSWLAPNHYVPQAFVTSCRTSRLPEAIRAVLLWDHRNGVPIAEVYRHADD